LDFINEKSDRPEVGKSESKPMEKRPVAER